MGLTKEQRHVAKTLIKVGKRMGASPKDIVTAIATGIVEANLTNPSSGDGTSVGWRQETSSSYPGVNRQNVAQSAKRFYSELKSAGPGSIGERAQAVQRSAYPGRYGEVVGEARGILKRLNRGGVGAVMAGAQTGAQGVSGGAAPGTVTVPGKSLEGERKLAALNFIQHRFEPGAVEQLVAKDEQLQDIKPQTLTVPGSKGKEIQTVKGQPVPAKGPLAQKVARESKNTPLQGNAIQIGTQVAKKFGLTVTSTTGGEHVPGSYHYQGRAIDISGSPSAMRKAYKYLQKNIPHSKLTELFYDPIGHYWDNGQKVSGAIGEHSDHVHLAI